MLPANPETFLESSSYAINGYFNILSSFDEDARSKKLEYETYRVSRSIIAGSILTVGNQFIQTYGTQQELREDILRQFREYGCNVSNKIKSASCGREVYGFPLGLLVYLGRNQHQHFHEGNELHRQSVTIRDCFNRCLTEWLKQAKRLAKKGNKDLINLYRPGVSSIAFDETKSISNLMFASNILHALNWNTPPEFFEDLRECIG